MNRHSLRTLNKVWPELKPPSLPDLVGDFEASFVTPLTQIAPLGLGLVGLRHWYGKRFHTSADQLAGVNLVRTGDGLREVLPMMLSLGPSLIDGAPCVIVRYPADGRRPWRWIRDELRDHPDGAVVGMTIVDLPLARRLSGAFLLTRVLPDHRSGLGGGVDEVDQGGHRPLPS